MYRALPLPTGRCPPSGVPGYAATKAVLVGAHLVAAAIIIPTLSQRLASVENDR
jgi:Family of unknown function (DUF6069)